MVRFSEFFAASALILGASASAVVDLIPSNFDDIVLKSGKPALVEFFAPWCGHCKTLAPVYEELASAFESSKDKVTIAKVDADAEKDLGKRFGVQGFPTLKWFDGKSDKPQDYSGGRDLESLTKFVTDKSGIKAKKARVQPSLVEMLNTKTFKEQIGKGKSAIVAFTAPWCGHCKTLAPVWEKLASDFSLEKDVLIAKVDCEAENAKDLAKEFGVSGYPTIKYFAKDSTEGVDYSGARSQDALVSFMNENAGTFRTVGGKLNDLAGTIPSLDSIVATLKSGGQTAYDELEKAAGGLTSGYAKYYAKVGKKALENKDYVANELTRLTNILKKGGLAPAKMDEITLRSNILTKFANSASEQVAKAVESAKEAVNSVKEEL